MYIRQYNAHFFSPGYQLLTQRPNASSVPRGSPLHSKIRTEMLAIVRYTQTGPKLKV